MLRFSKGYFILTIIFFVIEVLIGMYVRDSFIRPYGGDYLVVMLLYYFVRTFWEGDALKVAIGVLLFSYLVEFAQYFQIVKLLGFEGNKSAEILIGTGFSWWDILAYTLGIITVYIVDQWSTLFSKPSKAS